MTDADRVRQAQAGRSEAYAELVRRWAPRVLAVCHAKVGRADVADDMAQETFLRGFRSIHTLLDPEKLGAWLMGIALRTCLDWLKSKQRTTVPFSALGPDSRVPRPYRSVDITDPQSVFTSQRFGDPGFGQLSDIAPDTLTRGGEDGTEIGAFNRLLNPIKVDSLRAKVAEFLPFGLIPLFTTET